MELIAYMPGLVHDHCHGKRDPEWVGHDHPGGGAPHMHDPETGMIIPVYAGLAQLRWAWYRNVGIPDRSLEKEEPPRGAIVIRGVGHISEDPDTPETTVIYWEYHSCNPRSRSR